ncbi:hypothetical protein IU501_08055 [Nocardia otitidiscaviarum]|uniref:hypothetical protein n=1 Tax=Nocardia otitidiscaviarum TaxID=1823 RepID=UPI0004A71B84|nr:hypothetical protein [Nocardia otitidiscaviarum]MBF6132954.1 hypothetical protein [Nocardia otitidiscaviarum]MBF6486349.1 hypothetical protein [Nocardia otitidiscaviarum]
MTTLLVILIVWVLLSIPAALILARMFRRPRVERRPSELDSLEMRERARRWEFDRPADEFGRDRRPSGL